MGICFKWLVTQFIFIMFTFIFLFLCFSIFGWFCVTYHSNGCLSSVLWEIVEFNNVAEFNNQCYWIQWHCWIRQLYFLLLHLPNSPFTKSYLPARFSFELSILDVWNKCMTLPIIFTCMQCICRIYYYNVFWMIYLYL